MKQLLVVLAAMSALSACRKDNVSNDENLNGTYVGIYLSQPDTTSLPVQQPVELVLSGNHFQHGDLTSYGDVGDGSVEITASQLSFANIDAFPDNTSYINVSLSGIYSYTVIGDSLTLFKLSSNGQNSPVVMYHLKKQ